MRTLTHGSSSENIWRAWKSAVSQSWWKQIDPQQVKNDFWKYGFKFPRINICSWALHWIWEILRLYLTLRTCFFSFLCLFYGSEIINNTFLTSSVFLHPLRCLLSSEKALRAGCCFPFMTGVKRATHRKALCKMIAEWISATSLLSCRKPGERYFSLYHTTILCL